MRCSNLIILFVKLFCSSLGFDILTRDNELKNKLYENVNYAYRLCKINLIYCSLLLCVVPSYFSSTFQLEMVTKPWP